MPGMSRETLLVSSNSCGLPGYDWTLVAPNFGGGTALGDHPFAESADHVAVVGVRPRRRLILSVALGVGGDTLDRSAAA